MPRAWGQCPRTLLGGRREQASNDMSQGRPYDPGMATSIRNRAARVLGVISFLLGAACHTGAISVAQVEGPFTWGGVDNVTHLHHLWFSGQPDQAALEQARAAGVAVVINLRDPSEHAWDERSAVETLGMAYHNVPVARGRPFDRAVFQRIEALVEQHHEQQVLVHCASSNRVGGWLATHLVDHHGMSPADALAVGRRAGITKPAIEENVRSYLAVTPR